MYGDFSCSVHTVNNFHCFVIIKRMFVFVSEDHMLNWHLCKICYPLEIKLLVTDGYACARLGFMVQCFFVESNSLLLKNGSFLLFSFFCSFFLQVKWYTQETFNHDNKYWCCENAENEQISRLKGEWNLKGSLLSLDLWSHQNILLILMLSDRIVVSNKKTK